MAEPTQVPIDSGASNLAAEEDAYFSAPPASPAEDAKRHYGFSLFHEADAPPALRRLLGMLGKWRVEDEFTPAEFRQFYDSLSASGIALMEVEQWTESPRTVVLP